MASQVAKEIKFLAVGRRQDKVILCSRVHSQDKSYDYMEKVKMVMNSPGWATVTTDKLSLEDGGYMFWVSIDEQGRVYVAVTTRGYNARFIYSSPDGSQRGVLGVLKKEILERFADVSLTAGPNGLSAKAGPILKSLCDEFNDLKSLDKIAGVQAKVDAVTNVMQSNISLALRNTDRIEDIDEKANTLAESANKFKVVATNLKNSERCKLIKCYAMVALVVITILGIIIGVAVNNNQKK